MFCGVLFIYNAHINLEVYFLRAYLGESAKVRLQKGKSEVEKSILYFQST